MAWLDSLWNKASVQSILGDSISWADKKAKLVTLNSHKTELVWCTMNDVLSYYWTLADALDKEALREFIAQNFSKKRYDAECDPVLLAALDPGDQKEIKNIFLERLSYFENREDLEENYKKIIAGVLENPVDDIPEDLIRWIINENKDLLEEIYTLAKDIASGTGDVTKKKTDLKTKQETLKTSILPKLKDLEFWIHGVRTRASWPEPLDFGEPLDLESFKLRSTQIVSSNMLDWLRKRISAFFHRNWLKETVAYLDKIKEPEEWLLLLHWLLRYKLLNLVVPNHATEGLFFRQWLWNGIQNRSKFKDECDEILTKHFEKISPNDAEKSLLEEVKSRFHTVIDNYQEKLKAQYTV